MKYPKRSQYKYAKSRYRIRNWPEYEAGLRRRGDLTIWLSEDAIKSWREPPSGNPGGQRDLPLQDDHRSKYAKSNLRRTTRGSADRVPDFQHDDPARDARQPPIGVIPSRGTGDLSSAPRHGRVARAVARPSPLRSEQGDFHHSALPLRSLTEPSPRSERRSGMVEAGAP